MKLRPRLLTGLTSAGMMTLAVIFAAPSAEAEAVARAPAVIAPAGKGEVVGLKLVNRGGKPTKAQVVTFGQAFIAGTAPVGTTLAARIGKQPTPLQTDVKTRYADGSVKHAVLTLAAPALAAGGAVDVMLVAAKSEPAAAPISAEAVLAGGYTLALRLSFADGSARRLDAADLLRRAVVAGGGAAGGAAGAPDVWLRGPLVTEFRVEARIDADLRAVFDIRADADGRVRTGVTVANDSVRATNSRTVAYRADIITATHTAFSAELAHYRASNWRRTISSGADDRNGGELAVVRDVDYLIRAGAFPAFDTGLGVAAAALEEMAAATAKADTGPLGAAMIAKYMPTTGGRGDIGILPSWTAAYLISQDPRAERAMLANAAAAGAAPWHFHDESAGHYVRIDQHSRLWLDARARPPGAEPPGTSLAGLDKQSGWTVDDAHTPSLTFAPYLLTGERYYLDEAQAVGAWRLASFNPAYRGGVTGKQVRALAWELRDLGDIAYITPDDHPLKGYFVSQINAKLNLLQEVYLTRRDLRAAGEVEGWFMGDDSRTPGGLGPWQDDFMVLVLAELTNHGFPQAKALLNWSVNFIAGRFISGDRGFNPFYGPTYVLKLFDPATKTPTPTWRQVFDDSFPGAGPRNALPADSHPTCAYCLAAVAKAALAAAITANQSPQAVQAYDFLVAHTPPDAMAEYRKTPNWAIRPRLSDGRYLGVGQTTAGRAK